MMLSKKGKATRRSLFISLLVHGILFVILAFYIFNIPERVEEAIDMAFLEPVDLQKKPRPREPYKPKIIPRPVIVDVGEPSPSGLIKAQETRKLIAPGAMRASMKPATVTKYSSRNLTQGSPHPSAKASSQIPKTVDTSAKISPLDEISLDEPTSTLGDSASGIGIVSDRAQPGGAGGGGRGRLGSGIGSGGALSGKGRRAGLKLTETTHASDLGEILKDVTQNISLGNMNVPPLPEGEPGGRVIGRGRDIAGVFRFTRIRHGLSDWWADPTSLIGLAKWLNANTQIRADMNVEGGAIQLTDANLMKAPLVFMTGHAPAVIRRRMAQFQATQPTTLNSQLTRPERVALRKYLLEAGGMLFYDDCGLDSVNWPLMQTLMNELRIALPEYQVMPIPNDHEIYNCYYRLGGPPWGVASLWRHDGPIGKVPDYLKGLFIDGRLAVILSMRDYLCAAKTVNVHAGKVHKVTGAYQILTNVVIYALTHGKISDYSNYVPEIDRSQTYFPKRAPDEMKATPGK